MRVLLTVLSVTALSAVTLVQSTALSSPAMAEVPVTAWSGESPVTLRLDDAVDGIRLPMFDVAGLGGGATGSRCVALDVDVEVLGEGAVLTLHVEPAGGVQTLADGLLLQVEAGQGGSFTSCEGFVPAGPTRTATLAQLHRTTVDAPALSLPAAPTTFRVTYEVADDNRFQGTAAGADLIWTVR